MEINYINYFFLVLFRYGIFKEIYNIIDCFGVFYCLCLCVFSLNMMGMCDYKFICIMCEIRRDM